MTPAAPAPTPEKTIRPRPQVSHANPRQVAAIEAAYIAELMRA